MGGPQRFEAGQVMSRFSLVSCPWQRAAETEGPAVGISERGWRTCSNGEPAPNVGSWLVYVNFPGQRAGYSGSGAGLPSESF